MERSLMRRIGALTASAALAWGGLVAGGTAAHAAPGDHLAGATPAISSGPMNTVKPSIAGTAQSGSVLTASSGSWTGNAPFTFTYQWLRDGVVISGATAQSYVATDGDVGHQLAVRVTATDSNGMTGTAVSDPTATVAPGVGSGAPLNTAKPVIVGTARSGSVLSALTGSWTGNGPFTFTFQWLRDGVAITSATAKTYTATDGDIGHRLSVRVTAKDSNGMTGTAVSDPTASVTKSSSSTFAPLSRISVLLGVG